MCGNCDFANKEIKTPALGHYTSPVTLYLYHEDVDALYHSLVSKGVEIDAAPADQFWGDRMMRLTDLDGHQWSFATHVDEHA